MNELPRRVLMTCDTAGGVWTFALELAEALGAEDVEVLLAALGGLPTAEQRGAAQQLPNVVLAESAYKLEWMVDPWDDVEASGKWLLELHDDFRPDVVHLNSFGHGEIAWRAPVVVTAHSCVLSWWAAVRGREAGTEWDRYRHAVEATLARARVVTAPSRSMARALKRHYGFTGARAIYNGRSPRLYGQASKEAVILAAGRLWDEGKNLAALAAVAPRLPWPCCLAGETRRDVPACRALGPLAPEALAKWYARAAIYALPARYEPFGLSILEAALSGCALVLGDLSSLREIWGDAARFVPPEDHAALERTLLALIDDPSLRAAMAARALARARRFTPERMVRGYLHAYRMAATQGRNACAS